MSLKTVVSTDIHSRNDDVEVEVSARYYKEKNYYSVRTTVGDHNVTYYFSLKQYETWLKAHQHIEVELIK